MNKQGAMKRQLIERKRAEAEVLKAKVEEDDVRDELMVWFTQEFGLERAEELWGRFWKVRCHHLWDNNYRINFWVRFGTGFVKSGKIVCTFFVEFTKLKGFSSENDEMKNYFSR